MWIALALASAFFAGITAILAKLGIQSTDSDVAMALRTIVVLIFAWLMAWMVGSIPSIASLSLENWAFLILSGLATGASWLCYFRALQRGDVNKVVPLDKSSTVLAVILALIVFGEPLSLPKGLGIVGIALGTYLMIEQQNTTGKQTAKEDRIGTEGAKQDGSGASIDPTVINSAPTEKNPPKASLKDLSHKSWLIYGVLSAVFAALTSILGKMGIEGVDSNLGCAIRTGVVLVMAWTLVWAKGKKASLGDIPRKELGFILLSGIATGASWLCYYKALQDGLASVVVPLDKLSILITVAFSVLVLKEPLSKKALVGLALIVVGTLGMLF